MLTKNKTQKDLEYYSSLPYSVIVERWDDGQGPYWVARVAELPHCMIHGDTPEDAVREIEEVKLDWIRSNLKRGIKIPEPRPRDYSGQIRLRISPSIHRLLSYRAEAENLSLNQYMAVTLARAVGHYDESSRPKGKAVKRRAASATPRPG